MLRKLFSMIGSSYTALCYNKSITKQYRRRFIHAKITAQYPVGRGTGSQNSP